MKKRIIQVKALIYVDEVVLYDTEDDLINLLKNINPDVRIIGDDHKGKQFTGWDLSIDLYFNSRAHDYSTSELRKRIYYEEKALLDSNAARS